MLKELIEFYNADDLHPLMMLLMYWCFWPGLMFVVGAIFESRFIAIGKGQSRMFMPGDFMIGVGIVTLIGIHSRNHADNELGAPYWIIMTIICAVSALGLRHWDIKQYPASSRKSPTKITHDFCGFFFGVFALSSLMISQIWHIIKGDGSFSDSIDLWCIGGIAIIFFIAMTILDALHPPIPLIMHPDVYKPIWARHK